MTFGLDRCFPFAMGVRLLDLIYFERSLKPLFRVAVALLADQQPALLQARHVCSLEYSRGIPHVELLN